MKVPPFALLLIVVSSVADLSAQTAPAATPPPTGPAPVTAPAISNPMIDRVLSSLTPAEKTQILAARSKAMADNPGLGTDARWA